MPIPINCYKTPKKLLYLLENKFSLENIFIDKEVQRRARQGQDRSYIYDPSIVIWEG